jgi:hypothetical protein
MRRWLPALGLVTLLALWNAVLFAAPCAIGDDEHPTVQAASLGVYWAGRFVCHQRPERSFHACGVPVPVCARCQGLYFGALVGAPLALAFFSGGVGTSGRLGGLSPKAALVLAGVPTLVALTLEWTGVVAVPAVGRAACAVPLGAAVGWVVAAAVRGHLR